MQSIARQLLPGESLRYCCLRRIPSREGVDVWHSPEYGSAHFGGLMTCGSVWQCPVCAAKVSERRRELLAAAIAACRELGGRVYLGSYTISHRRSDRLSVSLEGFLAAQRSMAGNRPYRRLLEASGVIGTVKALEVTYGLHNGWHVHGHTLFFGPAELDAAVFEEGLARCWLSAAWREGFARTRRSRAVRVFAADAAVENYIAKWGHPPTKRTWSTEDELTKGHMKRAHRAGEVGAGWTPFDLLRWLSDTGEAAPARLFRDYAAQFKGRKQLTWTPGLADFLGVGQAAEKSDAELVAEVREDAVLLATLTPGEWRAVRLLDRRGEVLEIARTGDAGLLRAFVCGLVAELIERERQHVGGVA